MAEPRCRSWCSTRSRPAACRACRPSATASARTSPSPPPMLLRSADMHGMAIPASVRAIGRAGAGTNNIPVPAMSARGVPVFNAPGRQRQRGEGTGAGRHADGGAQPAAGAALRRRARPGDARHGQGACEDGKKAFAGYELAGPDAGHRRPGQDRLPGGRRRHQAGHERARLRPRDHGRRRLEPAVAGASAPPAWPRCCAARSSSRLHVPLVEATRHLVNAGNIGLMRPGAVLLNFSPRRRGRATPPCSRRWRPSAWATTSATSPAPALQRPRRA